MTFDLVEHIRRHGFKRLLLAVSGGLDSICLAHYFIENRDALGIEWLGIAHVHHGLRVGTADRDAAFVEEFAKSHGVPFFLKRLDGEALKAAEGSLEENARDARYKALVEIVDAIGDSRLRGNDSVERGDDENNGDSGTEAGMTTSAQDDNSLSSFVSRLSSIIVTAHHANDQAETMLMRLKRGTTLAGLRGIQALRQAQGPYRLENLSNFAQNDESFVSRLSSLVYIYRPFLNVTRAELLEYARKNKLTWCEDESNADVKFARNKIRHEILPNLERECPGATKQLCRIAGLADKAYAKVMVKCEEVFGKALQNKIVIPEQVGDDNAVGKCTGFFGETRLRMTKQEDSSLVSIIPHTSISLDKKKLNKILREHANADLSELFRLWLSELGFRFPIGFFYGPKEPGHVKIPVRAVYRKRSIVKIRHTIKFCEFCTPEDAQKFVSCEMNEKDYNEST
ncbi:MAG: tRNA lysidine(34) synthetase TilS [Fibrobacter sp.]|nr:tRNA lysidine(34) synthetase TilS [Fibrobacter sp.]